MNAGPASSMLFTKISYQIDAPVRCPSSCPSAEPINTNGTVTTTGTKMTTRCRNLSVVSTGSSRYTSRNATVLSSQPSSSPGRCLLISCRDASSMRISPVSPSSSGVPSSRFRPLPLASSTNVAAARPVEDAQMVHAVVVLRRGGRHCDRRVWKSREVVRGFRVGESVAGRTRMARRMAGRRVMMVLSWGGPTPACYDRRTLVATSAPARVRVCRLGLKMLLEVDSGCRDPEVAVW